MSIGGLFTKMSNSYSIKESFIGTIKDILLAKGGAVYSGINRNTLNNCELMFGFSKSN